MSDSRTIRENHFKDFMALSAEKRLEWAISAGYEMFSILPEKTKIIFEQMRHGAKRNRSSISKNK
ncbi:MAG: hypothetical protein KAV18_05820 [Candidatus Omnitrophica bacterium]|nr:hypothetical protein [Candidatus Omnitrophota bacterium]